MSHSLDNVNGTDIDTDIAIEIITDSPLVVDVKGRFNTLRGKIVSSYVVVLHSDVTADNYTDPNQTPAGRKVIYNSAADCLRNLCCDTFGVKALSKALYLAVSPKKSDAESKVLQRLIAVSADGLDLALNEMIDDAEESAVEEAVGGFDDLEAEDKFLDSVDTVISKLEKVRRWHQGFQANMEAVKRAVGVIFARDQKITDRKGIDMHVATFCFMMLTNKPITAQSVRLGNAHYAKSLKAAKKAAKSSK